MNIPYIVYEYPICAHQTFAHVYPKVALAAHCADVPPGEKVTLSVPLTRAHSHSDLHACSLEDRSSYGLCRYGLNNKGMQSLVPK